MNKFDQTIISIKKIISEGVSVENASYHIDFDLSLMRDKYCDGGIWYDTLIKTAPDYGVEVEILEKNTDPELIEIEEVKSVRIKSNGKQKLIKFLSSFINSMQFDYVCSWIVRDNQTSLDEDDKNVKKV